MTGIHYLSLPGKPTNNKPDSKAAQNSWSVLLTSPQYSQRQLGNKVKESFPAPSQVIAALLGNRNQESGL